MENARVIWKYVLPDPGDLNYETMPAGARVIAAGINQGAMVCWAEVDPSDPKVEVPLHVVGTGWPIPDVMYGDDVRLEHRATIVTPIGFVWHVYQGVMQAPDPDADPDPSYYDLPEGP